MRLCQILETLNTAYPYRKTFRSFAVDWIPYREWFPSQTIRFTVDSGIHYVWKAVQGKVDDAEWEIAFGIANGRGMATKKSGTGDAFKVFATILNITMTSLLAPRAVASIGSRLLRVGAIGPVYTLSGWYP